ncbi:MAG: radical SAM protein [Deltaproteobacteria bacterium]
MIPSRFNIIVEDYPSPGQNLLFNTRTQALIRIDHRFRDCLKALPGSLDGPSDPRLKENLAGLLRNGVVSEGARQEQDKLDDFFRQLKAGSGSFPFEVTVLTTYACNFRCVYCFEESVKRNLSMDERTADASVSWIEGQVEKRGIKRLFVVFYGGEPLLNTRPIYSISRRLRDWTAGRDVDFAFSMITNGSLLSPALVDDLLPLGLDSVRVSVDGDREAHDAHRPFADGRPTFDIVMGNIKAVADRVPVSIVGNFDRESFPLIPPFLDYLEAEGLLKKLKHIDFLPIAPRLGPRANPGAIELNECLSSFGKEGMFDEVLAVKKEIARRGRRALSGLGVNACSLIIEGAGVTIDPLGDIYACNALLGYPEFSVGKVSKEELNGRLGELGGHDAWKKCPADCPYVPMCQGGCRFFSFVENRDFSSLVCKRGYFDRIIPELIKLEYENSRAA